MMRIVTVVVLAAACRHTAPRADEPDCDLAAAAPADLVDVTCYRAGLVLDLRYATSDNFTKTQVYPVARCLLRHDVAERLVRVQRALAKDDLGLRLWDCYRPFSIQERFWALVPDERYVARPVRENGRLVSGSKHNRGAAVDVTLVDARGRERPTPSGFDDFSERAHRDARDVPDDARANSQQLERAMTAEGFIPLPTEWWHFDGPGWEAYDLLDEPLDRAR